MKIDASITSYIKELATYFPAIREVWLFGSRANHTFREESDWDLLAFADTSVLDSLRQCNQFYRENIDLLIVYNGDDFVSPWGKKPKKGQLRAWKWRLDNDANASYTETKWIPDEQSSKEFNAEMGEIKHTIRLAVKVWPYSECPPRA